MILLCINLYPSFCSSLHRVGWRSRDGTREDEAAYFKSMSYGADANRTFEEVGLLVFTDANVPEIPGARGKVVLTCRSLLSRNL
jgi:hypothetical protein